MIYGKRVQRRNMTLILLLANDVVVYIIITLVQNTGSRTMHGKANHVVTINLEGCGAGRDLWKAL